MGKQLAKQLTYYENFNLFTNCKIKKINWLLIKLFWETGPK